MVIAATRQSDTRYKTFHPSNTKYTKVNEVSRRTTKFRMAVSPLSMGRGVGGEALECNNFCYWLSKVQTDHE